jgi:predicted nucleotidyltransferase
MDLGRPFSVITPTVDGDVLAVLGAERASLTGRQVQQIDGRHSEKGVRNALHRLCGQGIVTRERVGSADLYTLNLEHLAAPYVEALAALRHELLQRLAAVFEAWEVPPAYAALFGSAARGDMTLGSDIDLLVVRPDGVAIEHPAWRDQLADLTNRVTAWTGNDARPLELSEVEVHRGLDHGEQVLSAISADGLLLFGPHTYLTKAHAARRRERRSYARRGVVTAASAPAEQRP